MTLKEMMERRSAIYATEIDKAATDAELDALNTELRKLDMMIAEEERKAEAMADPDGRTAAVTAPIPGVATAGAPKQENRKVEED